MGGIREVFMIVIIGALLLLYSVILLPTFPSSTMVSRDLEFSLPIKLFHIFLKSIFITIWAESNIFIDNKDVPQHNLRLHTCLLKNYSFCIVKRKKIYSNKQKKEKRSIRHVYMTVLQGHWVSKNSCVMFNASCLKWTSLLTNRLPSKSNQLERHIVWLSQSGDSEKPGCVSFAPYFQKFWTSS